MSKNKYYAIKKGKGVTDKIVSSWDECKELVLGYPSIYKSFKTEEEALEYLGWIKDVNKKLEENSKAKDYSINKKKSTVSIANVFKGVKIDKEIIEEFESKCDEMNIDKNKILIELIKEWLC